MCDSELARELRRDEIEAYLAKLRLVRKGQRMARLRVPAAALYKKILQAFSQTSPEKLMIVEKGSK